MTLVRLQKDSNVPKTRLKFSNMYTIILVLHAESYLKKLKVSLKYEKTPTSENLLGDPLEVNLSLVRRSLFNHRRSLRDAVLSG